MAPFLCLESFAAISVYAYVYYGPLAQGARVAGIWAVGEVVELGCSSFDACGKVVGGG